MLCTNCGQEIIEGAAFCTNCGTAVSVVETVEETVEQTIEETVDQVVETEVVVSSEEVVETEVAVSSGEAEEDVDVVDLVRPALAQGILDKVPGEHDAHVPVGDDEVQGVLVAVARDPVEPFGTDAEDLQGPDGQAVAVAPATTGCQQQRKEKYVRHLPH